MNGDDWDTFLEAAFGAAFETIAMMLGVVAVMGIIYSLFH